MEKETKYIRYDIIKPFLQKEKKLKDIEKENNISYATLKRWVNAYKKDGIDGLEKKEREDKNSYRVVPNEELSKIKSICENTTETNISKLYSIYKNKISQELSISYATFYKIVNNIDEFFNKDTVRYLENIKKANQCYVLLDVPLYILVSTYFLNKKIVPRLLIMLDSATLEPINFALDYYFSSFYSLLGFIREGIIKVSLKNNSLTLPKEILVASDNIDNKKLLKEIYNKLGIKIQEHYTENQEIHKFIKFLKNDIQNFYVENNYKLSFIELSEYLSKYIYLHKKEFAFSINYSSISNFENIHSLDIFLQNTSRKVNDSKIRVKNFLYTSQEVKEYNGFSLDIKFSPINPCIIYLFFKNQYIGNASIIA